jgi:hypothetical protein
MKKGGLPSLTSRTTTTSKHPRTSPYLPHLTADSSVHPYLSTAEQCSNNSAMALDHHSFHHLSLNHEAREFRLLKLLKLLPYSSFDDDVRCDVFHSSLDNHPPYEALSYAWGDPSITANIQCNAAPYAVTISLATALRYLRAKDGERIMWVDAICINQQDGIEKTHQVRQMRGIYTGAEQVRVWLSGWVRLTNWKYNRASPSPRTAALSRSGEGTRFHPLVNKKSPCLATIFFLPVLGGPGLGYFKKLSTTELLLHASGS